MSTHEGLPVHGYLPQSNERIDVVNANKLIEERLLRLCESIAESGEADGHWLAVARTHFEQGFMALNRSVFKPARTKLPEDKE